MSTCPQCNHTNSDTASFCSNCGATLSVNAATTAVPPSTDDRSQTPPSSSEPVTQAVDPPEVVPSEPSVVAASMRGPNWPLIAGIIGACVVASTGILAFALTRSQPEIAETPETEVEIDVIEETEPEPSATEAPTPEPEPAPPPAVASAPDITSLNAEVWKVVDSEGLNCRQAAGSNNAVSTVLKPGKEFLADTANYDSPLVYDAQGKPWLAVAMPGVNCLVRANTAYIQPLPGKAEPAGTKSPHGICPTSATVIHHLESANFDVFICGDMVSGVPTHYSGFAKNGSGGITVPITYMEEGGYWAENESVTYYVDTMDMKLSVEQGDAVLTTESLSWVN